MAALRMTGALRPALIEELEVRTAADEKARGSKAFASGDYEAAVAAFGSALTLEDASVVGVHTLHNNRAAALAALGRHEEALQAAERALAAEAIRERGCERMPRSSGLRTGRQRTARCVGESAAACRVSERYRVWLRGITTTRN